MSTASAAAFRKRAARRRPNSEAVRSGSPGGPFTALPAGRDGRREDVGEGDLLAQSRPSGWTAAGRAPYGGAGRRRVHMPG